MIKKTRNKVMSFLADRDNPLKISFLILAAIASGLYPLLHYYNFNFYQVNSWSQIFFFLSTFLALPCLVFLIFYFIFRKNKFLNDYQKYIIPILNYSFFVGLIMISIYGLKIKNLFIPILITLFLGFLLYRYVRKVIVFQIILAIFSLIKLIPDFYGYLSYSDEWTKQPDNIENIEFKKKPNVYIIQPDGYANFSELKNNNYNFNNNIFESFLSQKNFKLYEGFRSNYRSTLSSNSSMFTMKHHYYHKPKLFEYGELYNARDVIVGENPVVSIFKKNNYKTFLILEKPYLIINRPKMIYDYCNYNYKELSFADRGFQISKNIEEELQTVIQENKNTSNFYFIEKMAPNHISSLSSNSKGIEQERLAYLDKLKRCNIWLQNILSMIIREDPNSMIVIVADHGGYVGLSYTHQSFEKQTEDKLVKSIFTSALAIKWPNDTPDYDIKLKSNINLFRVLFSYLSENESYLEYLEKDKSYAIIKKGAANGVYELINEEGEVVFNKYLN